MVDAIFNELGIPYRDTRFVQAPRITYAVFRDSMNRYGPDNKNLITSHSLDLELYEYKPDYVSEKKLEKRLDELGLEFTKSERYWLESEQVYQVIYTLDYIEKGA